MSETQAAVADPPPRARRARQPSTDAISQPTVRRRRGEVHTGDYTPPQHSDIILPPEGSVERSPDVVTAPGGIDKEYLARLAFAEEPVEIELSASNEENAPQFVECWVNGRGIEFLRPDGKWRINWPDTAPGYAPIGVPFTTKRKYVECIVRKEMDRIKTIHGSTSDENPVNRIQRTTIRMAPLTIMSDKSPKAREWFQRLMAGG